MNRIGVTIGGRTYEVQVEEVAQSDTDVRVIVNGETLPVLVQNLRDPERMDWILVGNRSYEIVLDKDLQWLEVYGRRHGDLTVTDLEASVARPSSRDGRIKAPIPGIITRLLVEVGDEVEAGQSVLVLEAMKMENEIRAPRSGIVRQLNVSTGQGVALNEVLAEIE